MRFMNSTQFTLIDIAETLLKLNEMSTIAVPVIENLRPIDVPMIKNGPSMYLNDKKWPIDVPIKKQAHPSMYRIFEKKRDPLMYLAA